MILKSPGDICFYIAGSPVYWYGIIMALSCFIGCWISYLVFKKYNPDKDYESIWDFSVWVLIVGIVGARLYYCTLNAEYYLHFPLQIFNIRQGGLSIHGAVIFGILALIFLSKKYKLPHLNLLDSFACGTAFAQSIGRWGNFFNSEAFGYPSSGCLKLFIPPSHRPAMFMNYEYFHPAFLYESILDVLMFVVLLILMKFFAKKLPGAVFCSYLLLYSCIRLFIESFRIDSALDVLGIPVAKIMSFIWIFFTVLIFIFCVRNPQKD